MDNDKNQSAEREGSKRYFDIYPPVFYPAAIIIILFIALTLTVGEPMERVFGSIQTGMSDNAGWFFVLVVNGMVAVCLFLALSKYGNIRLGGKNAEPDFSTFAWFSMLFSAGMGIGLLFFSVAEPIFHYDTPPMEVSSQAGAARQAMKFTFLHWGLHPWAIYSVVGLSLAFFTFNRGMPLTIRGVFYPVLGDRIYGFWGNVIDVIAVAATLFGLATSLGLGVQQINSGLDFLFGIGDNTTVQVILIALITVAATTSVVLGLDKGVRVLSELNLRLGLIFLIAMLILGPTLFLFDSFVQNIGAYLRDLPMIGSWTEAYTGTEWQNSWTIFYWAWWISWSPYVGMFIARVSRGRTIREFILGVLLVPSLLTFLWMSVFGGSALFLELNGIGNIASAVGDNISTALFVLLAEFPFSSVTSVIGIILVTSFFVTSSDSGSLVIDSITSGGKLDAPVGQRIFWAVSEGAVAATLLVGGGLLALQAAAITTGLPFAFLLILMVYSLMKGLEEEYQEMQEREAHRQKESYQKTIADLVRRRSGQDVPSEK